jgi:hypothetical protein
MITKLQASRSTRDALTKYKLELLSPMTAHVASELASSTAPISLG